MFNTVALIILDGFGLAEPGPGNAVTIAHTPVFDRIWKECPHTRLVASGEDVGLPPGQMGNSEVGHMNLGAGRIVRQSLSFISDRIKTGKFFQNPVLRETFAGVGEHNSLHLMGLVSDGRVHSDLDHLYALMDLAQELGVPRTYIHAFTDGRDTAPDSGLEFIRAVNDKCESMSGSFQIATVCGRYFAMDRDKRWSRVAQAYRAVVDGEAAYETTDAVEAVKMAYERGETDEFIQATVIVDEQGEPLSIMSEGDAAFFFNFRGDRARQMTEALTAPAGWSGFQRPRRLEHLRYASMMELDSALPFAFELPETNETLPQVLAAAGKTQYHSAETEKYPHVTYFFNALREEPCQGETRRMVPSPQVATYDLQPQMSAPELTSATVERIRQENDNFILVNFANPDMVGHTGVLEAAVAACEAADQGLGAILEALTQKGGAALVVADHGNAECMLNEEGEPHTAHTTNLVPCVLVGAGRHDLSQETGKLGDVAPTLLELMGLPVPSVMTGRCLLRSHATQRSSS